MDRNTPSAVDDKTLVIWQWNCHGFHSKKAILLVQIMQSTRKPDMLVLQETLNEDVRLPGYRVHACSPNRAINGSGRGICTLIRKGIFYEEREGLKKSSAEHIITEVVVGKKWKQSIYILNVYSSPSNHRQRFKTLVSKVSKMAGHKANLIVCGDFNAHHREWGYDESLIKGRDLLEATQEESLILITDPAQPTRTGSIRDRDTTPDLTFVRVTSNSRLPTWCNTGLDLGSDHYILEIKRSRSRSEYTS